MSYDYTKTAATAARVIDKFGFDTTLHRLGAPTGPGYNQTPGTPETHTIRVVDLDILGNTARDSMVERYMRVLYMRGDDITPKLSDEITLDGKRHSIVSVKKTAPGGVAVLYEIEVTR